MKKKRPMPEHLRRMQQETEERWAPVKAMFEEYLARHERPRRVEHPKHSGS